jgi:hypothetical protein
MNMTAKIYCHNVAGKVEMSESCICYKTAVSGRLFIKKNQNFWQ